MDDSKVVDPKDDVLLVTAVSNPEDFRFHFVNGTSPWIGSVVEQETHTKIEVQRIRGNYQISIYTCGEIVARYVEDEEFKAKKGEGGTFHFYEPSSEVDLLGFDEAIQRIYAVFPEILAFFRSGFGEESEQAIADKAPTEGDKYVMCTLFRIPYYMPYNEPI